MTNAYKCETYAKNGVGYVIKRYRNKEEKQQQRLKKKRMWRHGGTAVAVGTFFFVFVSHSCDTRFATANLQALFVVIAGTAFAFAAVDVGVCVANFR